MNPILCDVIVAAVIALFIWRGWKRGFVLSLCSLLAIIVAFAGAALTARALSPAVSDFLQPRIAAVLEEQLDGQLDRAEEQLRGGGDAALPVQQVLDVLREMGVYDEVVDAVEKAIDSGLSHAAAGTISQAAAALSAYAAFRLIFLAAFLLILIIWTIVSHTLNLVTYLPGLHLLNEVGGAAIGLVKAVLVLFLAVWLMELFGSVVPEDVVRDTYLLRFFFTHTPMELLGM